MEAMDRDEVSQHYRRLGPLIYRRCLRLLGNPESARDATQEVFVRMLRHSEKLDSDRECLPWLYRVATNYCLNQIRDSKRLEFREPADLPEPLGGTSPVEVFLASAVVFLLAVLGMSLGTILGRRPLRTSCRDGGCGQCDHSVPHECRHPDGSEGSGGDLP